MHERGMADDELIDDDERDRFDGVGQHADRDGDGTRGRPRTRGREPTTTATASTTAETGGARPSAEYEQGREDERRFDRERITDDVRDSERTNR